MAQNRASNPRHPWLHRTTKMPEQDLNKLAVIGAYLAALRRGAGFTRTELAEALNFAERMVPNYESPTDPRRRPCCRSWPRRWACQSLNSWASNRSNRAASPIPECSGV